MHDSLLLTLEADLNKLFAPTLHTFEQELVVAGFGGLDDHEPHPPFAPRAIAAQQRAEPLRVQLEIRQLTVPLRPKANFLAADRGG